MTDKAETELKAAFDRISRKTSHSEGCEVALELGPRANLCDCDRDFRMAKEFAALSRPTQTADAVEAAGRAAYYASCALTDEAALPWEDCDAATQSAWRDIGAAALSTSADSGDREEVEPLPDLYEFLTATPQDSGLADELEAVLRGVTDNVAPDEGVMIDWRLGDRILTALRQPRNDGELLRENHELCAQLSRIREAINYSGATTNAYLDDMVKADRDHLSLREMAKKFGVGVGRIRGALARLDQGEG